MAKERIYAAIDLKSFYASVECVDRGLDPLTTNLVVADPSRTEKTICLAVSPSLKAYGIPGRPRLFEVVQKMKEVNAQRRRAAPGRRLQGEAVDAVRLAASPELAAAYVTAPPQMAHYLECSTEIYKVYLRYVAPEDIHVYSIDEVFIELTAYLSAYRLTPRELIAMLIRDVLKTTGITATAGIGTNLYLAKIAMDIQAKHSAADCDGVRIAELDEMSYRRLLWNHTPLTDFWRIGKGYAAKLEANGMYTMGDIARCSIGTPEDWFNEDLLYKLFGVNAELLIDHAWGWEPCTIAEIKAYKPSAASISSGQVLQCPYDYAKAQLVVREMVDLLVLDLVAKGLVTDRIVLDIGYDKESLAEPQRRRAYQGAVATDHYGRKIPCPVHGTVNIGQQTSSTALITRAVMELFAQIVDKELLVRRINIAACRLAYERPAAAPLPEVQLELFADSENGSGQREKEKALRERERHMQKAIIALRAKYGKNAVLKGMNLEEGATSIIRNQQIGGHKA